MIPLERMIAYFTNLATDYKIAQPIDSSDAPSASAILIMIMAEEFYTSAIQKKCCMKRQRPLFSQKIVIR